MSILTLKHKIQEYQKESKELGIAWRWIRIQFDTKVSINPTEDSVLAAVGKWYISPDQKMLIVAIKGDLAKEKSMTKATQIINDEFLKLGQATNEYHLKIVPTISPMALVNWAG